jgi:hypothetical protein
MATKNKGGSREGDARTEGAAGKEKPASRAIARVLWQHDFKTANPEATPEQRKEGWAQARTQYVKLGKQVQKRLERAGFVIQAAPGAKQAADEA